jgi:O6-methylguanine-DNA--protein-cysteine methyltransferase
LDQEILEALLEIPDWKVTSYKNLAIKFWVHSRRIASVMKMNKHPDIYPCYKVISHSWNLSWYSWPDGTNSKISMLEADWIKVVDWKIGSDFIV